MRWSTGRARRFNEAFSWAARALFCYLLLVSPLLRALRSARTSPPLLVCLGPSIAPRRQPSRPEEAAAGERQQVVSGPRGTQFNGREGEDDDFA